MAANGYGMYAWVPEEPDKDRLHILMGERGFTSTALDFNKDRRLASDPEAAEYCASIRKAGLSIAYAHAPHARNNLLWSADPLERARCKGDYCAALSFCARHGVPVAVVHLVTAGRVAELTEEGLAVFAEIIEKAEKEEVILAVENGWPPDLTGEIFKWYASPYLRFCYDSSHDFLGTDRSGDLLRQHGHLLAATHLSDNDGKSDSHCLPGDGVNDWELLKDALPDTYDGPVFLELIPSEAERTDLESYVNRAWAQAQWVDGLMRRENHERRCQIGDV